MPVIPNAPIPGPEKPPPPDVIDPVQYRFGGYQLPYDVDGLAGRDNIVMRFRPYTQPAFWAFSALIVSPRQKLR